MQASDLVSFARVAPAVARASNVSVFELSPTDESLESVFSYLVRR